MLSVLVQQGYDVSFVEENRDDKLKLLKNRIKKFGLITVINQLFFIVFSRLQLKRKKVNEQLRCIESSAVKTVIELINTKYFTNVNSENAIEYVVKQSPDCIILSGTRILSANFLACVKCPIINIHTGINPAYRGVYGGYWALVNKQPELFGATIHLVDEGVDTGTVLRHSFVVPSVNDDFSTYPLLQMSAALRELPSLLINLSKERQSVFIPNLPSAIWTHPTLTGYFFNRFKYGVK